MSMREYPNSGYVLPVRKILKRLSQDNQKKLRKLIKEDDAEAIKDFLEEANLAWLPACEVYRPGDEDTVDGETMEQGEIYLVFDEDALFEKTATTEMTKLQEFGLEPKFTNYSVWG